VFEFIWAQSRVISAGQHFFSPLISNQSTRHSVSRCAGWLAGWLGGWLAGSLTFRLPNMMRSPPARRSDKFNHYWLMFGSS